MRERGRGHDPWSSWSLKGARRDVSSPREKVERLVRMLSWRERDCHFIHHPGLSTWKARLFRTNPTWNIKNSGTWTVPTLGLLAPNFIKGHNAEHWDIVGLSHKPTHPILSSYPGLDIQKPNYRTGRDPIITSRDSLAMSGSWNIPDQNPGILRD